MEMSGTRHVHQWGSITDLSPGAALSTPAATKRAVLQLGLIAAAAWAICLAGTSDYWVLILAAGLVLATMAIAAAGKAARKSRVLTPELPAYPDIHRILVTPEERRTFQDRLALAERVGRTLPDVEALVDPNDAADLLAQGLWDGAKSLARRQEIRQVREELERHARQPVREMSRARSDLLSQQQRASALWDEVNDDLGKLAAQFTATAEAGEAYVRDRDLDDTLQRTERALAELSVDTAHVGAYAGEQLADETRAVLAAYRNLKDLYGRST